MTKHNIIDLIEFRAQDEAQLKQLTSFYGDVFSWDYKNWGSTYSDTPDSGLTSGINVEKAPTKNLTLTVIYSENLDDTKEMVIKAGGTIVQDTYDFPGGKRFHFTDPAGNELAVWSE